MSESISVKDKISQHYEAIHPIPIWKKIAAAMIGVLLLVIIITLSSESDEKESSKIVTTNKTSMNTTEVTLKENSASQQQQGLLRAVESPSKSLAKPTETNTINKIAIIKQNSDENAEQIASLSNQLNQLQTQLVQIPQENKQHQVDIQAIYTQLESLKSAQQTVQDALPKKVIARKAKRRVRVTPPFKLVSIDLWGRDMNLIVRHDRQLHDLSLGQSFGNWQVDSIDIKRAKAIFRNQHGVKHTLFIEL